MPRMIWAITGWCWAKSCMAIIAAARSAFPPPISRSMKASNPCRVSMRFSCAMPKSRAARAGSAPVISASGRPSIPTAVFSKCIFSIFPSDLYGHKLLVEFVDLIRPDRKFSSIEELVVQMHHDCENARRILARADARLVNSRAWRIAARRNDLISLPLVARQAGGHPLLMASHTSVTRGV